MNDLDAVVTLAAAAVGAAAVAPSLARTAPALVRACRRALGRVLGTLGASGARGAVLGLLGSGAVLLAPAAAAAPVPEGAPGAAAGPRAPRPAGPADGEERTTAPGPRTYLVRPGDCLWDIARRHLPAGATDAQVADAWPRWWDLNRALVGPDPALIHPGTRLVVPPRFRSTGTSTTAATAAPSFDPDRR